MEREKGIIIGKTELDKLQEMARLATRRKLENYERILPEWESNLALRKYIDGDDRVFELYVSSEQPVDEIVISSARVNLKTREVAVIISNLKRKSQP